LKRNRQQQREPVPQRERKKITREGKNELLGKGSAETGEGITPKPQKGKIKRKRRIFFPVRTLLRG